MTSPPTEVFVEFLGTSMRPIASWKKKALLGYYALYYFKKGKNATKTQKKICILPSYPKSRLRGFLRILSCTQCYIEATMGLQYFSVTCLQRPAIADACLPARGNPEAQSQRASKAEEAPLAAAEMRANVYRVL